MMRKSVLAAVAVIVPVAAFAQTHSARFMSLSQSDMLSSNLVGTDVYDDAGHDIGQIKDVAIGATELKGYILSVGGFLGMGTHYVAVNAGAVKVKYDEKDKKWHANMNATKDELKSAPEFKYEGRWDASKS